MNPIAMASAPILERLRNLRRLCSIMPVKEACRFTLRKNNTKPFDIFLPTIGQIRMRGGTSDIRCVLKIFVDQEYASPFKIEPRLIVDAGANIGQLHFALVESVWT
jgi:hypothetical protein